MSFLIEAALIFEDCAFIGKKKVSSDETLFSETTTQAFSIVTRITSIRSDYDSTFRHSAKVGFEIEKDGADDDLRCVDKNPKHKKMDVIAMAAAKLLALLWLEGGEFMIAGV